MMVGCEMIRCFVAVFVVVVAVVDVVVVGVLGWPSLRQEISRYFS